jgi:transcriptional regulator with XRE-family HTH domain
VATPLAYRSNQYLGDFLRSRRARTRPEDLGLRVWERRRVPGLRREELADLAGMSVGYYTRLEQGRHATASAEVLNALASALRLPDADRTYLHDLARPRHVSPTPDVSPTPVRTQTLRLLQAVGDAPAVLVDRHMDVLASNRAGRMLYTDFRALPAVDRNAVRWFLLDPRARALVEEWEVIAADVVGMLRLRSGRCLQHPRTVQIADGLAGASPIFDAAWAEQRLWAGTRPSIRVHHPLAGTIEFAVESMNLAYDGDQMLCVFMPKPGSRSARAWRDVMASGVTPQGSAPS